MGKCTTETVVLLCFVGGGPARGLRHGSCGAILTGSRHHNSWRTRMLLGMIVLGLAAFVAVVGFIQFCDWV